MKKILSFFEQEVFLMLHILIRLIAILVSYKLYKVAGGNNFMTKPIARFNYSLNTGKYNYYPQFSLPGKDKCFNPNLTDHYPYPGVRTKENSFLLPATSLIFRGNTIRHNMDNPAENYLFLYEQI